jgi:HSP20 family molecular chaperone IbpA
MAWTALKSGDKFLYIFLISFITNWIIKEKTMIKKSLYLIGTVLYLMSSGVQAQNEFNFQRVQFPTSGLFVLDNKFPSDDDFFREIHQMEQIMDRLMQRQLALTRGNLMPSLRENNPLDIQSEEHNNELLFKIKQPKGPNSKLDVSIKDHQLLINTLIIKNTGENKNSSGRINYSQSNYSQSFNLPKEYDPESMEVKTKDSYLMVRFKKKKTMSSFDTDNATLI